MKVLLSKYNLSDKCHINYITDDFLQHKFAKKYDLVVGNPPFYKLGAKDKKLLTLYRKDALNKDSSNMCSFFLDKSLQISNFVCLILPKFLLNTPEFSKSRAVLCSRGIERIIDFGENGFPGVLVETIAIFVNNKNKPKNTIVQSMTHNLTLLQKQQYICDQKLPYWVIFRNNTFDDILNKLTLNVFDVFRDRQITNTYLKDTASCDCIRVIKSRNITDDGDKIINIAGYDAYLDVSVAKKLSVFKYLNDQDVFLTPNMTYKPRVIKKPVGVLVNGSVAILIPKKGITPTPEQLRFFASNAYRKFYQIARNYQTRSLNVDSCSVYFYGLLNN